MKKPNAKFFCESCGAEVPQNARVCKHCGRFFSSVRCPVCGETGNPNKFANGCPKCGYAFKSDMRDTNEKPHISRHAKRRFLFAIKSHTVSPQAADDALPAWMYALTGCALFGILCVLIFYFAH